MLCKFNAFEKLRYGFLVVLTYCFKKLFLKTNLISVKISSKFPEIKEN